MKWYFCFNGEATTWFSDMIKVAVVSARAKTNLEPHCIYDGDHTPLIDWLQKWNVTVHHSRVSFRARFWAEEVRRRNAGNGFDAIKALGFYLYFQILEIEQEDEFVLVTDCDVMFLNNFDYAQIKPGLLAAVREITGLENPSAVDVRQEYNAGVMVINLASFRRRMDELLRCAEENGYYYFPVPDSTYDQGLLNTVFRAEEDWVRLPPELNWRVFFGINPAAQVVHWQGPKPYHVAKHLAGQREPWATDWIIDKLLNEALQPYQHYHQIFRTLLQWAG